MADALQAAIDDLSTSQRSLVAVNIDDDAAEDRFRSVLEYFDVAGADRETEPESPGARLVVTSGEQRLAAAELDDVYEYLFGSWGGGPWLDDNENVPQDRSESVTQDLADCVQEFIAALSGHVSTIDSDRTAPMVRVSRLIEQRANARRTGTVHAGFQQLSRLDDEGHTLESYRRLVDSGVDVHLYGLDDGHPDLEGATIHADPDGSTVGEYWFVVDDGGPDPADGGALLCRERDPGQFRGFWTFQSDHVADILNRLETDVQPRLTVV